VEQTGISPFRKGSTASQRSEDGGRI